MVTTIKRHRPGAKQKPSVAEVGVRVTETDVAMRGGDSIHDDIRGIAVEKKQSIKIGEMLK